MYILMWMNDLGDINRITGNLKWCEDAAWYLSLTYYIIEEV